MTFQTTKNNPSDSSEKGYLTLKNELRSIWLGWRDLNPRMLVPKTSALPLGDIPLRIISLVISK